MLTLELLKNVRNEPIVKILASKVSVACSGPDLENEVVNDEDRDIAVATTEVVDEDVALTRRPLLKTISNCSSGTFVDDTEHVETTDESRIFCGLALRVVEVRRHCDDSMLDLLAQIGLCGLLHLGEDHGGDFLRGEALGLGLEANLNMGLAVHGNHLEGEMLQIGLQVGVIHLAADEALDVINGVFGVHGRLVLGGVTNEALGVGESDP